MSDPEEPAGLGQDYSIGYGRPPKGTRFQPGKSGNPRGRPKGVKSIGRLLEEALARRVTINEGGRQRTMRMQDVIIQGLVNDSARRDPRALKQLFALIDRYSENQDQDDAAALLPDDRAILEAYLASMTASETAAEPRSPNSESDTSEERPQDGNTPGGVP
jgi:hypothetical protein